MSAAPMLLTLDEAAAELRVSSRTIRRLIDKGELHYVKIGGAIRVPYDTLKDWTVAQQRKIGCPTNEKAPPSGGLATPTKAARELENLLGRRIAKKPRHLRLVES